MVESTKGVIRFETPVGVPLEAAFDAGRLTSDGGLPWLSESDRALGGHQREPPSPDYSRRQKLTTGHRPWYRCGVRSQADPGGAPHVEVY